MKRIIIMPSIIIFSLFFVNHAFGRPTARDRVKKTSPIRRIDPVAPKLPGQVTLRNIPDPTAINVVKTGTFTEERPFRITACTLNDGTIFIGWEAFADMAGQSHKGRAGRGARYNTQFQRLGVDMIYTATRDSYFLESNNSVPLSNGNVLLAFNDKVDERNGVGQGKYVLLSPQMRVLVGPVTFCQRDAKSISATSMLDGDAALIAYGDTTSPTYQGKFLIVDSSGKIITQPKAYTNKGDVTEVAAGTTWNGKAFVAYNCSENGSLTLEVNVLGNISRWSRSLFNYQTVTGLAVCPLSNKNTLVLCNRQGTACSLLIGPDGKYIGGFQQFHSEQAHDMQATLLSNDNVFVSFTTPNEKAMCVVLDPTGKRIKGPKALCEGYNVESGLGTIAQTKLHNDMVVVITHGYRKAPHNDNITLWTVLK
ncbi:MAG: hypothetical protein JXM79_04770 [Sedimentisphaerales bacterium]|nr:hypothetical protein [Sedimentisphaerales bacterium]